MRQQQAQSILVYGTAQYSQAKRLSSLPIIDVTEPDWFQKIKELPIIEESFYFCVEQAYLIARKKIAINQLYRIKTIEETLINETHEIKISAARIGDILVSKKYLPLVTQTKVWLSPYHLELINELFKSKFKIEILDETGALVTEV